MKILKIISHRLLMALYIFNTDHYKEFPSRAHTVKHSLRIGISLMVPKNVYEEDNFFLILTMY